MAGAIFIQALGCLAAYLLMMDSQAAGMLAHLLMKSLSYYFLGCTFIILSLSNLLIKRGISQLKKVRLPLLILVVSVATASFLLIPRMDYLRETALENGMPVMLSPFANYFVILNSIVFLLLCAQIFCGALVAWRLARDGVGSGATRST
jgi:amino acid permease